MQLSSCAPWRALPIAPPTYPIVLLCEDEVDLGRTVAYSLRRDGFVVVLAATGQAALALSQAGANFDAVVLDLMLPDLSGLEVCRRLRAADRTRTLAILMATARGDEVDRVIGFEAGADDYVVKPYSVRELGLRIRAQLRVGRGLPGRLDGDEEEPEWDPHQ